MFCVLYHAISAADVLDRAQERGIEEGKARLTRPGCSRYFAAIAMTSGAVGTSRRGCAPSTKASSMYDRPSAARHEHLTGQACHRLRVDGETASALTPRKLVGGQPSSVASPFCE